MEYNKRSSSTRHGGTSGPKFRTRRHKANARERHRMHALNAALDRLRSCVPVQCRSQKLSRIETLRLARNYIQALSLVLAQHAPMDAITFARLLSRGLSQPTASLVAAQLSLSPRALQPPPPPPGPPTPHCCWGPCETPEDNCLELMDHWH